MYLEQLQNYAQLSLKMYSRHIYTWSMYASLAVKGSRDIHRIVSLGRPFATSIAITDRSRYPTTVSWCPSARMSRFPVNFHSRLWKFFQSRRETRIIRYKREESEREGAMYLYKQIERDFVTNTRALRNDPRSETHDSERQRIYYNTSRAG